MFIAVRNRLYRVGPGLISLRVARVNSRIKKGNFVGIYVIVINIIGIKGQQGIILP